MRLPFCVVAFLALYSPDITSAFLAPFVGKSLVKDDTISPNIAPFRRLKQALGKPTCQVRFNGMIDSFCAMTELAG
jgi:hypothetical protein